MTIARAVSVITALLIGVGLYVWLDNERNDVAYTTRSLIGQVRKGDDHVGVMLYVRKRFPEGDPNAQQTMFDELISAMHRSPVRSGVLGKSGKLRLNTGEEVPWRDVDVECENGDRYTVQWIKWRANWYIYDFRQ